jgi:hypothetical protein
LRGKRWLSLPSANGPIEGLEEAKKGKEIFFQKACLIKNNCYFCTRFDKQPYDFNRRFIKGTETSSVETRRHVHRHIGLTARLDSNV